MLAAWFAGSATDADAHRLARAAFALNPARHFVANPDAEATLPPSTSWSAAPPMLIHPRLREYGEATPRGPLAGIRDRAEGRAVLARALVEEAQQVAAARARLATGGRLRLSDLGEFDATTFGLFLGLLGDALAAQTGPDEVVECVTGDGLLRIRLEPLGTETRAHIRTPGGILGGRDHLITITAVAFA